MSQRINPQNGTMIIKDYAAASLCEVFQLRLRNEALLADSENFQREKNLRYCYH